MYFVGAFAEHYNEVPPNSLEVVLPIIMVHGLNNADTLFSATKALKDITKSNMPALKPYANDILNVCYQKTLENSLPVSFSQVTSEYACTCVYVLK